MNIRIHSLWVLALCAVTHTATAQAAAAEAPVRIIVPYFGGDTDDKLARIVAKELDETARRPYAIENRPGDDGHYGAEVVAKAQPDGRTLLFAPVTHYAAAVSLYAKLYYDLLADFAPVTLIANAPHVLVVHPSLRVKSVADVIALAKAHPGELKWGSNGELSLSRLEMEMFRNLSGVKIDSTPVNSRRLGLPELLSGNAAAVFDSIVTVLPHIKSNKLQALAVAGSARSPALPQLPTVAEAGVPGFEADHWYGILAQDGADPAIVKSLHADFAAAVNTPGVRSRLLSLGVEARSDAPADFARIMRRDVDRWAQVIKRAGIVPQGAR